MSDRKAVIKNADMGEEMQQDAVDCATQALEKYNIEKVIASRSERELPLELINHRAHLTFRPLSPLFNGSAFRCVCFTRLIQQHRKKSGKSIRDCFYACTPFRSKSISWFFFFNGRHRRERWHEVNFCQLRSTRSLRAFPPPTHLQSLFLHFALPKHPVVPWRASLSSST